MKTRILYILSSLLVSVAVCYGFISRHGESRPEAPLFISDIATDGNGSFFVSERGTLQVNRYDALFQKIIRSWSFDETPTGVAVSGGRLFVTTFQTKGKLFVINLQSNNIVKEVAVGSGATSPIVNAAGNELYVLNQFSNNITAIDLQTLEVKGTAPALREPRCAALDKEGRLLFVANFLPQQRADLDTVAACVSVIDLKDFKKIKDIPLYNGSNALRGICLSPDGKYIFVTHNLGRFQVPTNQLQQGWMNTSGVSVLNVEQLTHEGTVLLDDPERGAAGIWGVKCTDEAMIISHSGTHEISVLNYPMFIERFEQYPNKEQLAYDLRFLYGMRERVALNGNGPRNLTLIENKAYIPSFFSDHLNIVDLASLEVKAVELVENRKESAAQAGEKYFNDATYCFQNWQSCNGCHPGDARTDGMNWDLMNDGIGNSKNCKSMLYSHVTPPSMISGIRESAELAVRKGYALIQFCDFPEEKALCVDDYLRNLRPVPSPYLVDGRLTPKAEAGRKVFDKLNCGDCHSGPQFTDMKMHRIGDDIEFENGWDTPTLIEVWRTAPYLFDGRAATLHETFNDHKHGINQKVSPKEMDELVEYVNSL